MIKGVADGIYARSPAVRVALVALAAALVAFYLTFAIITAQQTLGCDYFVYRAAALDWLAGAPIYDLSIGSSGSCNIYYYPPPFVLLVAPFAVLPPLAGLFLWIGFLVACFVVGCWVMPVRPELRLVILMVGAASWPFVFGVRIGQVGPILFLLFSLAWRWLERPRALGAATALSILIKLQPAVLVVWMAGRRMTTALLATIVVGLAVSIVATLLGIGPWSDMITSLRTLDPGFANAANFSIGATAYRMGFSLPAAGLAQVAGSVLIVTLVALWAVRGSADAGLLVAVVASQYVSPVVWSHYALILLLPVAWLVARGHWWALFFPVAQAWVLIGMMPPALYPVSFLAFLIALPLVDGRRRATAKQLVAARA